LSVSGGLVAEAGTTVSGLSLFGMTDLSDTAVGLTDPVRKNYGMKLHNEVSCGKG